MYVILNISDSDKHWEIAIQEYTKRLGKTVLIENIKPVKGNNTSQIIEKETELILEKLEKKYKNWNHVILDKSGQLYSTEDLLSFLGNKKTVFVIGGPFGLDEKKISKISKISFGKITLAHGLAKLTLLEQIYRIGTIESGKKYHY